MRFQRPLVYKESNCTVKNIDINCEELCSEKNHFVKYITRNATVTNVPKIIGLA